MTVNKLFTRILGITISVLFLFHGISEAQTASLGEQLEQFSEDLKQEKIYLKTNKPYYTVGDTIWYRVFALSAKNHSFDIESNIIYVDLRGPEGELVDYQNVFWHEGTNFGEIPLDKSLKPGEYILSAYTTSMLGKDNAFAFSRQIEIYGSTNELWADSSSQDFTVQFFPEGGDMISGISSKVAFKAVDEKGRSVNVTGSLFENGEEIKELKTLHAGHGYFQIQPNNLSSYSAKFDFNGIVKEFSLPDILDRGATIKVANTSKDFMTIELLSTDTLIYHQLIGHMRGNLLFEQEINEKGFSLRLPKAELPDGIITITLINALGQPISERLVFSRHENNKVLGDVKVPYQYFNQRQKSELSFELKDDLENPLQGDFAITVYDNNQFNYATHGHNIENYFLLTSDIKGYIEEPGYYFEDYSTKRQFLLDLLLLTQGWRRFDWKKVNAGIVNDYDLPEPALRLSGQVTEKGRPKEAVVTVSVMDQNFFSTKVQTDAFGQFEIQGIPVAGDKDILVVASYLDEEKNSKKLKVSIDEIYRPILSEQRILEDQKLESNKISVIQETIDLIVESDSIYNDNIMRFELGEVSIRAKREYRDKEINRRYNVIHNNYDNRLIIDEKVEQIFSARNAFDYLRNQVPGIEVVGPPYDRRIRMRGVSTIQGTDEAILLLDGIETTSEVLSGITIDRIAFIDVLKGTGKAAIYGSYSGAVAIFLKDAEAFRARGKKNLNRKNTETVKFQGTHIPKEFYSPDYSTYIPYHDKEDYRTCLFWNPNAKTLVDGTYEFSFYTGDISSFFVIEVEGIAESGQPFIYRENIEVR